MNEPTRHQRELMALLIDLMDDVLSDEGRTRLNALCKADASCRRIYLQVMSMHGMLLWRRGLSRDQRVEHHAETNSILLEVLDQEREAREKREIEQREARLRQEAELEERRQIRRMMLGQVDSSPTVKNYVIPRSLIYIAVAAAIALVAMVVAPFFDNQPDETRVVETPLPEAVESFAARVVAIDDAVWAEPQRAVEVGAALQAKDVVHLESGTAHLRFANSAEVSIEGPVQVEILANDRMRLIEGKIAGRCEQEARGFTVDTLNARIVDLGTAFEIGVSNDSVCDLRVIEGEVEAALIDDGGNVLRTMSLDERRAVRMDLDRRTMRYLPYDDSVISGTRDVITLASDAGRGGYELFPNLCRLADGRIMMTFSAGYGRISMPNARYPRGGALMYRTSHDEGRTWSAAQLLLDTEEADHRGAVTQLSSGELLGVCSVAAGGTTLSTSVDYGATWSEPQPIAPTPYNATAPIRELSNGRLIVPLSHATFTDTIDTAVVYSDDRGVTWSQPVLLPGGEFFNHLRTQGDILEIANGRLMLFVQAGSGNNMPVYASNDFGETWRETRSPGLVAGTPSVLRLRSGDIAMVYREDHPGSRRRTMLTLSRDDGRTWSESIAVDVPGGGYPSLLELSDGSIIVAYMDSTRGADIHGKRFRVTDGGVVWLKL